MGSSRPGFRWLWCSNSLLSEFHSCMHLVMKFRTNFWLTYGRFEGIERLSGLFVEEQNILGHTKTFSNTKMIKKWTLLHLDWQIYYSYVSIVKLIQNTGLTKIQFFKLKFRNNWKIILQKEFFRCVG